MDALRKKCRWFASLMLLFILSDSNLYAQAPTISYPAVAQNLTRGYSQDLLTVKLVFNSVCSGTNTVRVAFPASVTYVPGSVNKASGSSGVNINESSISNLSRPEFSVSGISMVGDSITFTVARRAGCGSMASAKDSIYFIAGSGCSDASELAGSVNSYNIFAPALSLTPPPTLTGTVIGTTGTRTTTITNGGNGITDTVRFYIVYPGGGIVNTSGTNAITANGVSFTPAGTSGDTLFYKISGTALFGGDNNLDNGETITIQEPIQVAKCNANTTYGAAWGRNAAEICERQTATSAITIASGVPNFNSMTGALIGYVDKCTPFDFTLAMTNNGSGNSIAAGLYDILVKVGQHYSADNALLAVDTNLFIWSDVRLNGISIPASGVFWDGNRNLNVELNNLFTTDPDGAGTGLADLDGDGFFDDLEAGKTVTLRITQTFKCNLACGYYRAFQNTGATMAFRRMCETSGSSRTLSGNVYAGVNYIYEGAFQGKAYVPANVAGGIPFRFQARHSFYINNSSFDNSNTRYRWKIALPAGFSVAGSGAPAYGTGSVSHSIIPGGMSGADTIVYTSSSNVLDSFSIDLVYSCGGGSSGSKSIYYALEKIDNIATGCACGGKMFCNTISTATFCPGPCPGGAGNYIPVVRRANGSLGWTDYTMATRQTAAAISAYNLSKALYLDTIIVQCAAKQGTAATDLRIELTLPRTGASLDKLMPVRAVSWFYRSGALIGTCTTTTSSGAVSTPSEQSVVWDLSTCLSGLPGGSLLTGDSIYSDVYYVVAVNDGFAAQDVQSGGRNIYYNLVSGAKQYCMDPVPEMYLARTYSINGANAYVARACIPTVLGSGGHHYARRFNSAGTLYQNEFRPGMLVDSIVLTMPAGYDTTAFRYTANTGGGTYNISPARIAGNQLTFINPGWPAMGITVENAYGANFYITVTPTCATVNNEIINAKTYIRDYYYAYAGSPTPAGLNTILEGPSGVSRGIGYNSSDKPGIRLANQTGTVQGTRTAHSWTVRLNNPTLQTAPYVWLAIPDHSGITVNTATDLTAGSTLTPISYSGGKWYQVSSSGIASGSFTDVRLDFTYTTCSMDSLKVYAGWNCSGYPSDPVAYTCGKDSLFLKLDPLPSQVQLSVSRQPGGGSTIPLCTEDSTIIVLNSAQAANLIDPYITFYPPAGVTLLTPVRMEYPLGSGSYEDATVTAISGGGYKINLNGHSGISSNGMPGTARADPAYTPAGGDRQAHIAVRYNTDCNYTSGTTFRFYGFGNRPCGSAALDNGVATTTNALHITGASAPGSASVQISFDGGATSFGCRDTTFLGMVVIPTSTPTQTGDTLIYTLPSGVHYAGGGLAGTDNCDTCSLSAAPGPEGTSIIKVKLDAGVSSGSIIFYGIRVTINGEGCSSRNITGAFKRDIPPLSCNGTPCASSSVIIANGVSPDITLNKPSLSISNIKILDTAAWRQANYNANHVKIFYSNNGSQAYTANRDTVEFFCNIGSTTPFAKRPLTKDVAIGASDSDEYYIMMPLVSCVTGDEVMTRIQTTTAAGTPQCLCSPSSFRSSGVPLPLDFLQTAIGVQDCAVQLSWRYNKAVQGAVISFTIERSNNGGDYKTVAITDKRVEQHTDMVPQGGTWYYRIKALQTDGSAVYTRTLSIQTTGCATGRVAIYPNPASSILHIVLQGSGTQNVFEIIDALGRVIMKGELRPDTDNTIASGSLAQGVYLIRVTGNEMVHTQQIEIKK